MYQFIRSSLAETAPHDNLSSTRITIQRNKHRIWEACLAQFANQYVIRNVNLRALQIQLVRLFAVFLSQDTVEFRISDAARWVVSRWNI